MFLSFFLSLFLLFIIYSILSISEKNLSPEVDREIDGFESEMMQRCLRALHASSNNQSDGIDANLLIDMSKR